MNEIVSLEILRAARERITPREQWTAGELARNSRGGAVSPESPSATCWCALGAVLVEETHYREARPDVWFFPPEIMLTAAAKETLPTDDDAGVLAKVNDTHGHDVVLQVFDRAIEKLEAELEPHRST